MRDEDAANSQLPSPRLSQEEINLTEFPIALLSDRAPKNKRTMRRFTSGNKVWEIHGDPEHGFPTHLDHEVYVILMEVTYEQGFPERVLFSRHDLLRRLGWGFSATRYARLQQALDCWAGVKIRTINSFYDKTNKKWLDRHIFHLLEESRSIEQDDGERSTEGATAWFRWSETIRQSMQARYLKPLDVDLFLKLKSAVAQMLYRYLDAKRLNGKVTFQQSIITLGKQHLGMPEQYYPSQIKRLLDPAHEELIATGFLESAHYEPMRASGGEKVVYRFTPQRQLGEGSDEPLTRSRGIRGARGEGDCGDRALEGRIDGSEPTTAGSPDGPSLPARPSKDHPLTPSPLQPALPSLDAPLKAIGGKLPAVRKDPRVVDLMDSRQPGTQGHPRSGSMGDADRLAQQLVERGMTAKTAARLVAERREECERQLAYLPYRPVKNPGGTLRKAIEEAWAPPPDFGLSGQGVGSAPPALVPNPKSKIPNPKSDEQATAAREAFAAAWAARSSAEQEMLLARALDEFRAENALGATCLARAAIERQIEVLQPLLWEALRVEG